MEDEGAGMEGVRRGRGGVGWDEGRGKGMWERQDPSEGEGRACGRGKTQEVRGREFLRARQVAAASRGGP